MMRKDDDKVIDQRDGSGLPCALYSTCWLGACMVPQFGGMLYPALFASCLLADPDSGACVSDEGFCDLFLQFTFCSPCAAAKFYRRAQKTAQTVKTVKTVPHGQATQQTVQPQKMYKY